MLMVIIIRFNWFSIILLYWRERRFHNSVLFSNHKSWIDLLMCMCYSSDSWLICNQISRLSHIREERLSGIGTASSVYHYRTNKLLTLYVPNFTLFFSNRSTINGCLCWNDGNLSMSVYLVSSYFEHLRSIVA